MMDVALKHSSDKQASEATLPGGVLHEIFAVRAAAFPDRIALSENQTTLTYAALDAAASRVAGALVRKNVGPGVLVGLYLERGIDKVIGMLGILKAGGAYVPIDPAYPEGRVRFIVEDSRLELMVSASSVARRTVFDDVPVVLIDELQESAASPAGARQKPSPTCDDLAYVIYTSGSTGQPKGVLVEHRNVVRLFEQTWPWFHFDEHDVWSLFHSISFDFSVWEIWGALLYGGRLVIVPHDISRSPTAFRELLAREKVTVLNQTPSAFGNLELADRPASSALHLRFIIFGGEELRPEALASWVARRGEENPALVNMYGITETTVHVTAKRLRAEDVAEGGASPIGHPIPDLTIHLLDENQAAVPDGLQGEMYIQGDGVTRGYLNRPELTAQRFVMVSLGGAKSPVRLYRTGDLATYDGRGGYVYKGRVDDQIKVRGFRIEPREVELCLGRSHLVRACHVGAHDFGDGDMRLAAYVVPAEPKNAKNWTDAATALLKQLAGDQLPSYMRPSAYVVLAALPLTPHGKVDRKALPRPESSGQTTGEPLARVETTTEEEGRILRIWSETLGLKGIGLEDDFFDFGGTSLALIRSLSLLKQHYHVDINPSVLVDGATARNLAEAVRATRGQTTTLEISNAS